jgi:hypothetical protein
VRYRTTVPVVHRHVPDLLQPTDLTAIRCRVSSGVSTQQDAARLLDHIDVMGGIFRDQQARVEINGGTL